MAKHPVWRGYDPTANKAIARVDRQRRKKKEEEGRECVRRMGGHEQRRPGSERRCDREG
ncbi:MAG: hypothetical protein J6N51_13765 [Selenomonas sp.]|nr:hypothetical protein [Selenomonas sp.]